MFNVLHLKGRDLSMVKFATLNSHKGKKFYQILVSIIYIREKNTTHGFNRPFNSSVAMSADLWSLFGIRQKSRNDFAI